MSDALLAGSLASHLAVATAFALLFGVAASLPQSANLLRWSAASVPVVGLRLTLAALAVLGWPFGSAQTSASSVEPGGLGIFDSQLLLPWLQWFASVITALIFAWVLLLPRPHPRWDSLLLGANSLLVVVLALSVGLERIAGAIWPAGFWSVAGLLLTLSVVVLLAVRRISGWPLHLAGYTALAAGFGIDGWFGSSLLRAVEALAYPAMCYVVIRSLVRARVEEAVLEAGGTDRMSAAFVRTLTVFGDAMDSELLTRSGLRLISQFLRARSGVLITGPDQDGGLTVEATVDLVGGPFALRPGSGSGPFGSAQGRRERARLPLRSQVLPGLTSSLVRGRARILPKDKEFEALKEALGLRATGLAMLAPLQLNGGRKGGMLLFSDPELQSWSSTDLETLEAWANSMSEKLAGPPETLPQTEPTEQVESLKGELRLALEELAEVTHQSTRPDPIPVGSLTALIEGMREPIISIQGYSELLAGGALGKLGSDQRKFLEQLNENAAQVVIQLNSLLRLVSGSELQIESRADVINSVETAVAQVGASLQEKGQSLHLDLPERLPAVGGDPDVLRQILVTLIEHAIQASPPGAVIPVSAIANDSADGVWVSLSVSDSGSGILPEELGRVFQSSDPGRGADTGLAHVKLLAEGLGGRVWIGSEVGGGSTVTVLIPASEA
ncbi:MAG: HAMP domain-containing sensor histidine kinase [Chloroflexota bacterium]